jgi:autotransporter-associated beta strand protein
MLLCLLVVAAAAPARAMYFWDTNDTGPDCGSSTPTGTWGVDNYWNDTWDGAGTNGTHVWGDGYTAVFCAGNEAVGTYTITVSGTQQVAGIHVDLGTVTFEGGAFKLMDALGVTADRLLSVGHKTPDAMAIYHTPLTTAQGITRYKRGTLILGVTNTYSGSTTIEGGILQLGAPYVIPTNSMLILANNTTNHNDFNAAWADTPATFATGGFSQRLGALKVAGENTAAPRIIDFGNGASALAFADSSKELWSYIPVTLTNYTPGADSLRFGTNAGGLTKAQLSQLRFADFGNLPGQIDARGYVTPLLPVIQSIRRTGP